jgi:putative transcription factor
MPNISHPTGQDWEPVNAGQSHAGGRVKTPKTARELSAAKEAGLVSTEKRFGAGGNASAHSSSGATIMSARKLEEADEPSKILKVDKSLSKAIMQARTAKKMTQKDLATAINEKPQVVAEYESGKAIPNPQIITKLERKLGCKLPRPGKQTIATATTTSSSTVKKATTTSGTSSGLTAKQASLTRGGPPKRR